MADQSSPTVAPYGTWRSPISPAVYATGTTPISLPRCSDGWTYWLEQRAAEQGRTVLLRASTGGEVQQLTPAGYGVRTRAHEYGGGDYAVQGDVFYFANDADQRIYRQSAGGEPQAITPTPSIPRGARYADLQVTPDGRAMICVRESHSTDGEAVNDLVWFSTEGSTSPHTVASGHDFYSSPRLSPDGTQLAWLTWDHPRMPWDGTELWVGDLAANGDLSSVRRLAGGAEESLFQPEWTEDGKLLVTSDRTGWWNLYRVEADGSLHNLAPIEAELGRAQWVFGMTSYAQLADGRVLVVVTSQGTDRLGVISPASGEQIDLLDLPFNQFEALCVGPGAQEVTFVAAGASQAMSLCSLGLETRELRLVRSGATTRVDPGYVSAAVPIRFPTRDGQVGHALYYPPANYDFVGPDDERPPLVVRSHGGPTSRAIPGLHLEKQFWTSRGFALVDVNYRGSTGYGRPYRDALKGQWGILDVADCIDAARYLVDQGLADASRMVVRGGSAGGYLTLCALVFHPGAFAAGASYYGIGDLETLATDTHKFESRYLDALVGPYPADRDVYLRRSPANFVDQIGCPVIILQGADDKVVPPDQAERMVRALEAKKLPYAYLVFEGEGHGFRKRETLVRAIEAELYFYARVFGMSLADAVQPVPIANL